MAHELYRVKSFSIEGPYQIRARFDDNSEQLIDMRPILAGELYGPLRDLALFNRVELDRERGTLVWPNGADFDPETLRNWPQYASAWAERAKQWERDRAARV
jgi:phage terminase large subunit-like protein